MDTNVIVSAVLTPTGKAAEVLDFIINDDEVLLFYSPGILAEYEQVLSYSRLSIDQDQSARVVRQVRSIGCMIDPIISEGFMSDESDRIFNDTARMSNAILVTGNVKHFPDEACIMTPAAFLLEFKTSKLVQ